MNTNKLPVNILIDKLLSGIHSNVVQCLQVVNNPIQLIHQGIIYNIYLKNISHAGKPYPENQTRAQLPKHQSFDRIKNSNERFLFLGYAKDSDVFVCWDPIKAKSRLNNRDYVSFFSRKSLQDSTEEGDLKKATLTNGDVFVIFKRVDFEAFLNTIEQFFPDICPNETIVATPVETPTQCATDLKLPSENDVIGILTQIENDPSIQILVESLFYTGQSAIGISAKVMNQYSANYPNMQFKDWGKVIRKYIEKLEK